MVIRVCVLTGNHYHLQFETREADVSAAMQWLNLIYEGWFSQKYWQSHVVKEQMRAIGSLVE